MWQMFATLGHRVGGANRPTPIGAAESMVLIGSTP
jgi:hypothetical protein